MTNLNDMSKEQILDLFNIMKSTFKYFITRTGDSSTSVYFFNTKNSVNSTICITNELLNRYEINPEEDFKSNLKN